jgi:hypothetical protein
LIGNFTGIFEGPVGFIFGGSLKKNKLLGEMVLLYSRGAAKVIVMASQWDGRCGLVGSHVKSPTMTTEEVSFGFCILTC